MDNLKLWGAPTHSEPYSSKLKHSRESFCFKSHQPCNCWLFVSMTSWQGVGEDVGFNWTGPQCQPRWLIRDAQIGAYYYCTLTSLWKCNRSGCEADLGSEKRCAVFACACLPTGTTTPTDQQMGCWRWKQSEVLIILETCLCRVNCRVPS